MANPLKKLAGETAVYGLSTILARIINFAFVPIYTRLLTTANYGIATEFLAYIAVLQVILTMGLETGSFRFANKEGADPGKVYSNALAGVGVLNLAFLAVVTAFSRNISSALGYDGFAPVIIYIGIILTLDNFTAILFARLRQEHRALRFAVIKTVKILTETGMNLWLFLGSTPWWMLRFVSATPDFSYIIFSILVSSVLCALLLIPELATLKLRTDAALMKKMLAYSLPLMVAALPGIMNDFLDRILFRFLDTNAALWQSSLGVFQAGVKLAVIMNLFIQMFRYAAEPFFFQNNRGGRDSKLLQARVTEYFTAFCGIVFLGVILYIDVISLLIGASFRDGVRVVPIMLGSYMLLGLNFNISMWYKLGDRTKMALWITLAGLAVTIIVNVLFMPRFSYWAAAAGHLLSYLTMFVISAVLGQKYNPFPYRWGRMAACVGAMISVWLVATVLDGVLFEGTAIGNGTPALLEAVKLGLHTMLIAAYGLGCYKFLKN